MADQNVHKFCKYCGLWKDFSEFHKCKDFPDGYAYKCKACVREYGVKFRIEIRPEKYQANLKAERDRNEAKRVSESAEFDAYILAGIKTCTGCKAKKPFDSFYKNIGQKDGRQPQCIECAKAKSSVRYAANPESQRLKAKLWRESNPEKHKDVVRRANAKRKDARRAEKKAWDLRNKDHIKAYDTTRREITAAQKRERYAANPEPHRKHRREYEKNNPLYRKVSKLRRRAKKRAAAGSHTAQQLIELLLKQDYLCANPYCKVDLTTVQKTADHILALANGGSNDIGNIQWLCMSCNSRKSNLDIDVWLRREEKRKIKMRST